MNRIDIINTHITIDDTVLQYLRKIGQHDITTKLTISDIIVYNNNQSLLVSSIMFNDQRDVVRNHAASSLMASLSFSNNNVRCHRIVSTYPTEILRDSMKFHELPEGYVISLMGHVYSFKNEILHGEPATTEPPGAIAIRHDEAEIFQAIGGNKIDGAEKWDCVYFQQDKGV